MPRKKVVAKKVTPKPVPSTSPYPAISTGGIFRKSAIVGDGCKVREAQ